MRKSKVIKEEAQKAQERLDEIKSLLAEAELEELNTKADIENKINALCGESSVFCGVVLTPEDILSIVSIAIKQKENIKIPFRIYLNE